MLQIVLPLRDVLFLVLELRVALLWLMLVPVHWPISQFLPSFSLAFMALFDEVGRMRTELAAVVVELLVEKVVLIVEIRLFDGVEISIVCSEIFWLVGKSWILISIFLEFLSNIL